MVNASPKLVIRTNSTWAAKRLVDGVTDLTLSSGVLYAGGANTLKGPVVDQTAFVPDLSNPRFQDNANEAVHRFIN